MARTGDPNSATSQFYFNLGNNSSLNYVSDAQPGYAVFGRVVEGLSVMDAIGSVPTATRFGASDFPLNDVIFKRLLKPSRSSARSSPRLSLL